VSDFFKDWAPLLAIILAPTFGFIAARWNRKSQVEANNLTGSGQVFTHQSTLLQDVQEERNHAKAEIDKLRKDFEDFKQSVKSQFSGYRAYIHGLRGQVHELGGVPIKWPDDLDQ
jgi:chromosome segregation ATPase